MLAMRVPAKLRRWVERQEFTYAVTMPDNPHEYILETKTGGSEFDQLVALIREHGDTGRYKGSSYRYVTIGDWVYWVMPARWDRSLIINRKKADGAWD